MGEQLSLLGQAFRIPCFNRLYDTRVNCSSPLLKQTAIGDLVCERVLEGVFEFREKTRLIEKLAGLELGETAAQILFREIRYGLKQNERHILANDSGRLQ